MQRAVEIPLEIFFFEFLKKFKKPACNIGGHISVFEEKFKKKYILFH